MRLMSMLILAAAVGLAPASAPAQQAVPTSPAMTVAMINNAQWLAIDEKTLSATALKAQVLLDRAGFSPGVIDGYGGENFRKALTAYQRNNGLAVTGQLDQATWAKLTETAGAPVTVEYRLVEADVKGPFVESIPSDFTKMGELKRLAYRGPRELLAEKFHMDEDLLATLNPEVALREGSAIIVANVYRETPPDEVASVQVDKTERSVRAFAADGKLIAYYPASVGSEEKPAPSGKFEIRAVVENPVYRYNPDFKFKGQKAREEVEIAPGPNNPVGAVWIALTADTYGIHGTPSPDKVSKTASNGCVRLTNWDALALAKMVKKGTPVVFKE